MKHLTDQELMKIVQAGDYSPASEIYDRYSTRIYNFARRILRNDELAADATQEVFLKLLRHSHSFKENASLPTWLFAITANWCRDYFRRLENRTPKESSEVLVTLPAEAADDPRHRFERKREQKDSAKMIADALQQLTHDQREAVVLARYHDMTHADIAKIVGCSIGAVKTRIFRGMEAMRHHLMKQSSQDLQSAEEGTEVTPAETPVEETNV